MSGWTTKRGAMKHKGVLLRAANVLEKKAKKAKSERMKKVYLQQADGRRAIAKSIGKTVKKHF